MSCITDAQGYYITYHWCSMLICHVLLILNVYMWRITDAEIFCLLYYWCWRYVKCITDAEMLNFNNNLVKYHGYSKASCQASPKLKLSFWCITDALLMLNSIVRRIIDTLYAILNAVNVCVKAQLYNYLYILYNNRVSCKI